ncbi:PEROXISOMAL SARCOSINE OXIDASE [Salix purpurea]|uniref:PEROXISOMAL SARCOSINE OXIDASE n=1 Tax=Salix purpurea TaxID=77065 RepID=A0A9Q0T1Y2_SALPP|nr:PEROXISOMAL SARCOSINE OXIDASE [Salix purpurea]
MECSSHHFDAIVVGAGIMGSSTAYQLAKRGQKTLLLEQFDFLHHRGSSHGESRTIRATYPEDYYCDMVMESLQMWEQAQSEAGYKVYFKAQQFDMSPSDNKSLRSVISSCEKNSIPYRVLDRQQVSDRFSGMINIPEDWFAVLTDVGGVIKPTKAVSMFQALAFQRGAVLRDNMECVIGGIKEGKEAKFAIGSDFPTFRKLRGALRLRHTVVGVSGIDQDCRARRVPL